MTNEYVSNKIEQQENQTEKLLRNFFCNNIFKNFNSTLSRTKPGERYDADLTVYEKTVKHDIAIEAKYKDMKYYPSNWTSDYMINNTKLELLARDFLQEREAYLYINWFIDGTIACLNIDEYGFLSFTEPGMFRNILTIDKKNPSLPEGEKNKYGISWKYYFVKKTQYDYNSPMVKEIKIMLPQSLFSWWQYDSTTNTYNKKIR